MTIRPMGPIGPPIGPVSHWPSMLRWRPEHQRIRSSIVRVAARPVSSQVAVKLCDGGALAFEQAYGLSADLLSHAAPEGLELAAHRLLLGLNVGEARGQLRAPGGETDFQPLYDMREESGFLPLSLKLTP